MLVHLGRQLRFVAAVSIAIILIGAVLLALNSEYGGASGVSQTWQKILQSIGTMAMGLLYLWREYLREKMASAPGSRPAASTNAPQIVQNIYPPQTAATPSDSSGAEEAGETGSGVIRARRIVIADDAGRDRIVLGIDGDDESEIRLSDRRGRTRLRLAIHDNHDSSIELRDCDGRRRASLLVRADGFGELTLLDREGGIRAMLGSAGDDATSYLGLRADRTYALVLEGGRASQNLWNEDADLEWSIPIEPPGDASAIDSAGDLSRDRTTPRSSR
ncbi:MAG: hypothetical protein IVW54_17265 [Candidatus Binataceae bacterium]|nr:hypothetical protein [Candidatus Binataceae bacterium]